MNYKSHRKLKFVKIPVYWEKRFLCSMYIVHALLNMAGEYSIRVHDQSVKYIVSVLLEYIDLLF